MPNSNLSNVFWKNVHKRLIDKDMTFVDLANDTGLSRQSMIIAKHTGSELRVGTVIRFSDALGVAPSSLLGIDPAKGIGPAPEALLEGILEKAIEAMPSEALRLIYPCLSSKDKKAIVRIANSLRENN